MKRTGIQRKTPMQRGGKLKQRSDKPRKFRDVNLQDQYRDQKDYCEVSPWLRRNWPEMYFRDERLDLHHIVPGNGGRYDKWSNMIRLNRTFHEWVQVDGFTANVICLGIKLRKNELDLAEYTTCAGWRLEWWLEKREPRDEVRQLWDELIAVAKTQSMERT